MKNAAYPKPPAELLDRCLTTIPASATDRPLRPRLSLELPSRSRLKWLSLTAAVPIVTVLAIVPARHYLNASARAKKAAIESATNAPAAAGAIRGFQSFCDFLPVSPHPTRSHWFGPSRCLFDVWDSKRGHYSGTWDKEDFGTNYLRRFGKLETPDGDIYSRSDDTVVLWHPRDLGESSAVPYPNKFRYTLAELFDPKRMTQRISGYPHNVPKDFQVVVEKRERGVFLVEGRQEAANVIVCVHRPVPDLAQEGAPTIRVRFYQSVKTGLPLGYSATAFWPETVQPGRADNAASGTAPIEIGQGVYLFYGDGARSDGGKYLDKKFILEDAHVVSSE